MDKIEWIKSELLPDENPYTAVSRLNSLVSVPNPAPQGKVPDLPSLTDLISLVALERLQVVIETQAYRLIAEAFARGENSMAFAYFPALFHLLEESEIEAIQKRLAETLPDPTWQKTIMCSLAEKEGYEPVTLEDVLAAQAD